MRLLTDHGDDFLRHAYATQAEEIAAWRADNYVGSGATVTDRHIVRDAVAKADQREHHGDLDADRNDAEQSAKRAVFQILKDETVDQFLSLTATPNLR